MLYEVITVAVLLGGRIAEELIFGESSTGAQNDLVKATDIAKSMVKAYGMSEKLGTITLERERQPQFMQIQISQEKGDYSDRITSYNVCYTKLLRQRKHRIIGVAQSGWSSG